MTKSHDRALDQFLQWARTARTGDLCEYYSGNIAHDRRSCGNISTLADTAFLLSQCQYISLAQMPIRHSRKGEIAYVAIRTGTGHAPRSVLDGTVTAQQHMALEAIRTRQASMSATRALRYGLSVPETIAERIMSDLRSHKLIECSDSGGWDLSERGRRALL